MNRKLFQQFLHTSFNMTDDVLLDQIFKYFNSENDADITREEWVVGFYVFLKGTEEEQTQYCFKIYDINDDGFITKEEMLSLMKDCMVRQGVTEEEGDGDEGVKVTNQD
jgi:Ca2+-binding EF-hand superfamily protein